MDDAATTASAARLLGHAGPPQHLERDELAYRQGDRPLGLYQVRDGVLLLEFHDAHGNTTAFGVVTAGQFFGYRSYFAGTVHAATARAVGPSTVLLVPRAGVESFLRGGEDASRFLLRMVARDPGPLLAPILRSPYLPARLRVAYCIMHFAPPPPAAGPRPGIRRDPQGAGKDGGGFHGAGNGRANGAGNGAAAEPPLAFRLPIGRVDLAAMVALRPETLSRVVTQLGRDGGIQLDDREVRIADPATVRIALAMPPAHLTA